MTTPAPPNIVPASPAPPKPRYLKCAVFFFAISLLPDIYVGGTYYNAAYGWRLWNDDPWWMYWVPKISIPHLWVMTFFYLLIPTVTLLSAIRVMRRIRKNRDLLYGSSIAALTACISILNLIGMFLLLLIMTHFPAQT